MQKFYKYFSLTVIASAIVWFASAVFSSGAKNAVSAQTAQADNCPAQNVFVLENDNTKIVHLVYDFSRSTVSIVQVRKGYNPPELTVRSMPLGK